MDEAKSTSRNQRDQAERRHSTLLCLRYSDIVCVCFHRCTRADLVQRTTGASWGPRASMVAQAALAELPSLHGCVWRAQMILYDACGLMHRSALTAAKRHSGSRTWPRRHHLCQARDARPLQLTLQHRWRDPGEHQGRANEVVGDSGLLVAIHRRGQVTRPTEPC